MWEWLPALPVGGWCGNGARAVKTLMANQKSSGGKKKLKRIPDTAFERSLRVISFGIKTGITAVARTRTVLQQAEALATMMGEMKGSLMKAGQLLGMVGEHFFPPEVNAVLRTLNAQSDPVAWPVIEKSLVRRLGKERMAGLEIDEEPWAAASLGQVHRATIRATGQQVCLKIQYPGVAKAIESDLRSLRTILRLAGALPVKIDDRMIFAEVRSMLLREVDYAQEMASTREFAGLVRGDARFVVPEVIEEFSTPTILATAWQDSLEIEHPRVKSLSRERKTALAQSFLELFFAEFFSWNLVQTDPHFGNYRVRVSPDPATVPDQLVLLDFGAVRRFPPEFVRNYARMVRAALAGDEAGLVAAGKAVGILPGSAAPGMTRAFLDLCMAVIEPFNQGVYDWGASDLPKRCTALGMKLVVEEKLPSPPKELLFLDRKLGGVFIFLSHLGARMDARALLEKAVDRCLEGDLKSRRDD